MGHGTGRRHGRPTSGPSSRGRAVAAAVVVLGVSLGTVTLGQAAAVADGNPVGDLTATVKKQLQPVTGAVTPRGPQAPKAPTVRGSTPSQSPGAPASADHSGGNDVADPQAPDHAGADVVKSTAGGQDLVGVGNNRSTVNDDDSTSSDASALTIGGTEVAGAHASSGRSQHQSFLGANQATDPVCEQSAQAFCATVLYADADATDHGGRSHSDADSGLFSVCAGGTETSEGTCQAPVNAAVAQSTTQADRDQASGRTTASSGSSLANACLSAPGDSPLPGLPGTPGLPGVPTLPAPGGTGTGCALGADLVSSQGHSDSGGSQPTASRSSSLAGLTVGGQRSDVTDPQALELPPGCPVPADPTTDPTGASALCAYLNQGETYVGPGSVAGHAQEAVKVRLLPGVVSGADLLSLIGARTETLVHNDGGEPVGHPGGPGASATPGHHAPGSADRAPATVAGEATGGLPNTGGPAEALLIAGLLAVGAGAMLVSLSRMRRLGFGL